jgi:uncharacterized membrane protein
MSRPVVLLWTALLSFMPISELRGAIPFAVANGIPWYLAYPFAAALNILVAPVCWIFLSTLHKVFYGIPPLEGTPPKEGNSSGGLKGFRWYRALFDGFVERARDKLKSGVEKWGWLGIAAFVAIPLPITGAWTGTLGAWVLGLSKKRTLAAVIVGVIIAGAVVTAVTLLGIRALSFFLKDVEV